MSETVKIMKKEKKKKGNWGENISSWEEKIWEKIKLHYLEGSRERNVWGGEILVKINTHMECELIFAIWWEYLIYILFLSWKTEYLAGKFCYISIL